MNLYPLLRPLLFSLAPETAHNLSLNALDQAAKSAPAGSEAAFAAIKSAMETATTTYELNW